MDTSNNARKKLAEFKNLLDPLLEAECKKFVSNAAEYTGLAEEYAAHVAQLVNSGGKRLRPAFVYYGYKIFGGDETTKILQAAIAVELMHMAILIDDDFMDEAKVRHNTPTLHSVYADKHRQRSLKKDAKHFGICLAANVATLLDHYSSNVLLEAKFEPSLTLKAIHRLNDQLITTCHGQIHDVYNEVITDVSLDAVEKVLSWKTATYTFDNPIRIGAVLAGASDEMLNQLSQYTLPAGVAFQIQDDILGTFGKEDITGKAADGDIKEGKNTLLTVIARGRADTAQREILDQVLGNQEATHDEIDAVRKVIIETGSLDYSKSRALELVSNAKKALETMPGSWVGEAREFFLGIADVMINRDL